MVRFINRIGTVVGKAIYICFNFFTCFKKLTCTYNFPSKSPEMSVETPLYVINDTMLSSFGLFLHPPSSEAMTFSVTESHSLSYLLHGVSPPSIQ